MCFDVTVTFLRDRNGRVGFLKNRKRGEISGERFLQFFSGGNIRGPYIFRTNFLYARGKLFFTLGERWKRRDYN